MKSDNSEEVFPVVDEYGTVVGQATRGMCHGGSMLLHPVVHLHVFDSEGRLYLQRRPDWKDIQPGKWDTAVGGHIDYGEDTLSALRREAREELGIIDFESEFITSYVFTSSRERELVNAFKTIITSAPCPSEELAGGMFWSLGEIDDNLGKGIFTPNFEEEYKRIIRNHKDAQ